MSLHKLDETASFTWWDLDIGDLTEALEERSQLVLGHVARKTADKDSGVVWISELVHRLWCAVVPKRRHAHLHHSHLVHADRLVLRGCSRDTHGSVTTVDALHLGESPLLVHLVSEANESVASRDSAHGIGHDLGRLARRVASLE